MIDHIAGVEGGVNPDGLTQSPRFASDDPEFVCLGIMRMPMDFSLMSVLQLKYV